MHTSLSFLLYGERELQIFLEIILQATHEKVFVFVGSEIFSDHGVFLWTVCMCSRHISKPQMVKQSLWMGGSERSSRPVLALLWAVAGTQHRLKC